MEKTCKRCETPFSTYRSTAMYCSPRCGNQARKGRYAAGRTERTCENCKTTFLIEPSRATVTKYRGGRFCSTACKAESERGARGPTGSGRFIDSAGYVRVSARGRPGANKSGYMTEHRIVMEEKLGRRLRKGEHVHHVNGIKDDNRPDNLALVLGSPHYGSVVCPSCGCGFLIR